MFEKHGLNSERRVQLAPVGLQREGTGILIIGQTREGLPWSCVPEEGSSEDSPWCERGRWHSGAFANWIQLLQRGGITAVRVIMMKPSEVPQDRIKRTFIYSLSFSVGRT